MSRYWWLSFADGERPTGQQFLGVAIVPGVDIVTAASMAHALGCNPGGEVVGYEVPFEVPPSYIGRLLTRAEALELDAHWSRQ